MSKAKGKAPVREKNEYIPQYISKKPFYIDDDVEGDYLEHQRLQGKKDQDLASAKWYERGKRAGPAATKYRKGACENCGAMTHKTKECLSRPRKLGARWTGKDIQPDEIIETVELGWDGKRDRWNGYNPREHDLVVEEYQRLEELKRKEKEKELQNRKRIEGDEDDVDNDDKYAEELGMPGQTYDAANRISTRNLRIREDTAKYLLNLDLNSAKYDPKTRTMVNGTDADPHSELLAEDNFMRSSGDAAEFEKMQRLAWESRERGDKVKMHLQANPTEGELYRKQQLQEQEKKKAEERNKLLHIYGGAEHLSNVPLEHDVAESEAYVEYTPSGEIKGREKAPAKSKYAEDKYIGNHTSVWGSWWKNFQWGYACCHSVIKNSYCTGSEGIKANEEAEALRTGRLNETKRIEDLKETKNTQEQEKEQDQEALESQGKLNNCPNNNSENNKQEDKHEKAKRKHAEMIGGVTEEELEEYRRQKKMFDDPMAAFLNKKA
ncbi:Pre-mRNA splicing Prp18-interacting factor-domain-containing protein [Kalaharituber pfeilii]|nr:Pre-mRNA splicing Prp18-interacting factor-domain-containing protein [Kalaharituber pfeilii]